MINQDSRILFYLASISDTKNAADLHKLVNNTNISIGDLSESLSRLKEYGYIKEVDLLFKNYYLGNAWSITNRGLHHLTKISF